MLRPSALHVTSDLPRDMSAPGQVKEVSPVPVPRSDASVPSDRVNPVPVPPSAPSVPNEVQEAQSVAQSVLQVLPVF